MAVFRRLVFAALCAGLLSGVFATVAHQIGTVPLILQAETYEKPSEHALAAAREHTSAWEPKNGAERTAYTLVADILTGIGFALLLGAGLTLRGGGVGWRQGLLWGLAGFAIFTVAPSLAAAARKRSRAAVRAAALVARHHYCDRRRACADRLHHSGSLGDRSSGSDSAAHLYGGPEPAEHNGVVPAALAHHFVIAARVANFLFWLILGASTGYFHERLQPKIARVASAGA
jgi:predicted cobalt transporter CbtA